MDKYIRRIRRLLEGFEEFYVSHILREDNVIANKMVNVGVRPHDQAELVEDFRGLSSTLI